jgi:small-conductance mechanosensitive channel
LYSPVSDYDVETIVSVLVSILFSIAVVVVSVMVCSPETKIPLFSYNKNENTSLTENNVSISGILVAI